MPDAVVGNSEALSYCTFGAACTEVELDVLTGEQRVLRSDILFDCGRSINPAVDMGQVRPANAPCRILSKWDKIILYRSTDMQTPKQPKLCPMTACSDKGPKSPVWGGCFGLPWPLHSTGST